MESVFEKFSVDLEKEFQIREQIKDIVKNIEPVERKLSTLVQQYHSVSCTTTYQHLLTEIEPLKIQIDQLKSLIKPELYFKYREYWKFSLTNISFSLLFSYWIEKKQLLKIEELQSLLNLEENKPGAFSLELEDYLIALCNLSNELSRYCLNCVIRQDYETPSAISKFESDLFAGFRLLNLKNDIVRKRYDSMKYDLKRIEEVVYDISVRGLKK
ncbi:hypothetical protein DICPUDRAFT_88722 [Dictyostelium purpureum]|uniref:Translin n=1 Tax=Dictyostelium purpureum TaxID=5786 RepID=F0ZR80_DICPU|nr:uncharacterized protein DICPUDRAFT_88722 [Dictyostelium purpureum]EGC33538.1 hypothetical protein DICPUDRAFT_88722 [Dictyostelium purpureum]|eukprot:XP_003289920.1 hypothetical protein DICPUDRAFT_88722 [Dictyostelium purpureum]